MMNAVQKFKQKLKRDESVLGLFVSLESPTITEIAVHLGLDWVCIDTEHGHLDFNEVLEHLRATARSFTVALVRIQEIEQGLIKRVLDLGADGIILPQIRTAKEVERAVCFAKYPPRGVRGIGGERATLWGKDLERTKFANQNTLIVPLIETVAAGKNIQAIMSLPEVDGFFLGPADYSASAGYLGKWEAPEVSRKLLQIKDRIRKGGFPCGIVATDSENGKLRIEQGFQMIGLGTDCGLFIRAMTETMSGLGRKLKPATWTAKARS